MHIHTHFTSISVVVVVVVVVVLVVVVLVVVVVVVGVVVVVVGREIWGAGAFRQRVLLQQRPVSNMIGRVLLNPIPKTLNL